MPLIREDALIIATGGTYASQGRFAAAVNEVPIQPPRGRPRKASRTGERRPNIRQKSAHCWPKRPSADKAIQNLPLSHVTGGRRTAHTRSPRRETCGFPQRRIASLPIPARRRRKNSSDRIHGS